jgi:flagellar biosynthesis protein FlhF
MKTKSYFAKSVDEAIAQARAELGSEALLLNTRKVSEPGKPSGYEVVLSLAEAHAPERPVRAAGVPRQPVKEAASPSHLSVELENLRGQMNEIRELLSRNARNQTIAQRYTPELARVHARLVASELDPALSTEIVDRVERIIVADSTANTEAVLRAELEQRVTFRPRLGVDGGAHGAVSVVVGPAGGGKTTTLAKLAHAASAQHPVRLLSLDRLRQRQLELVKDRHNISLVTVDSLEKLPRIVAEARKEDCVLIDTPGFSAGEEEAAEALANALNGCPDIDVQLVVPAYMKAADLRQCVERYQLFRPSKLLVTKLDEAQTFGTLFSEAVRSGLALSFVTFGPGVPDDIREATVEDVLGMSEERAQARAQTAA